MAIVVAEVMARAAALLAMVVKLATVVREAMAAVTPSKVGSGFVRPMATPELTFNRLPTRRRLPRRLPASSLPATRWLSAAANRLWLLNAFALS